MLGSNIRCHGPSQLPAVTRLPCILASLAFLVCSWAGCTQQDPIVTYTVPTKIPAKLMPGKDRMLAAMLPKGKEIWFFKVTGPEEAIESLQGTFRDFVEDIEFQDGSPKLKELPDGWRRGGKNRSAMRLSMWTRLTNNSESVFLHCHCETMPGINRFKTMSIVGGGNWDCQSPIKNGLAESPSS